MGKRIVFRLDAGMRRGLGHLSRCLSLAETFPLDLYEIIFIVKTDVTSYVEEFIAKKNNKTIIFKLKDENFFKGEKEMQYLFNLNNTYTFFIFDTYEATTDYQLQLKNNGIRWLQFDSHGKIDFYADMVLHGSPGATKELYTPLVKNKNLKLLLGTKYALINKKFLINREKAKVRKCVKNIFVCLGGGDDRGATIKIVRALDNPVFSEYNFRIFLNSKNKDLPEIEDIALSNSNIEVFVDQTDLSLEMLNCDLGIIAPGTMSYEAACLGLPMLLVSIADNQYLNSKAWEQKGCALFIADNQSFVESNFSELLLATAKDLDLVQNMSAKCMDMIDGKGINRVAKEIFKDI